MGVVAFLRPPRPRGRRGEGEQDTTRGASRGVARRKEVEERGAATLAWLAVLPGGGLLPPGSTKHLLPRCRGRQDTTKRLR